MKRLKIILVVVAFAVPVLLHAQEQSTAPAQAKMDSVDTSESWKAAKKHEAELKSGGNANLSFEKRSPLERHRLLSHIHGSHKINIQPVKQTEGIKTGVVVAYGHIIPAPYKIEYVGEKLFVNGVQVRPSLAKEQDEKKHPVKMPPSDKQTLQESAGSLINEVKTFYKAKEDELSKDDLHQQILTRLGKHTDSIQGPVWRGETLCYKTPVYSFEQCVNFGQSMFSSAAIQAKNSAEIREEMLLGVQNELKNGNWIFFSCEGTWFPRTDVRAEVNKIMGNTSLSKDQKVEALKKTKLGGYALAEDIADNYSVGEWGSIK